MRKICIYNMKGGVGKTTTAVNLAAGLARKDKKVLLLDMDPQGNVSTCLSTNDAIKDMYHLIANGAQLPECITHMGKGLDLVTSKESLLNLDQELSNNLNQNVILKYKMEKVTNYDYVIIDCAPHLGVLTKNAIFYADEIFIPVSTDILGLEGLKKTIELITNLRRDNTNISKIIPTMFDKRTKIAKKIHEILVNEHYGKVSHPISFTAKLKEVPKHKRSIFSFAKNSQGAKDYQQLVTEVLREEPSTATVDIFEEAEKAAASNE